MSEQVTVALATYRRPEQAVAAVRAVLAQLEGTAGEVDVLVVDNDPAAGARSAIEAVADDRVRYVVEAVPGIAAARNRALDESAGRDLLVFVDDDEEPAAGWLAALLETYRRTRATAVSGPVESRFDVEPEEFVRAGGFFARRHRQHVGTGDRVEQAATNNLLLDLAEIRRLGLRFDEEFGLSGGSDTLFTRQLVSRGGWIAWCREAVVVERVAAARVERRWLLTRAISYGTTDVRVAVRLANGTRARLAARARAVLSGVARIGYGSARWLLGRCTRSVRSEALGLQTLLRGVGLSAGAFGYSYERYRRPSSR